METLTGKTAAIVGGGTGIGSGIALAFSNAGAKVIIGGRREAKLNEVAEQARNRILTRQIDATDRDSVAAFFEHAFTELSQIDVLVNAAGMNIRTRKMCDMTPEQWDELLQVNLTSAYNTMYSVLPHMRERGDGLIINISSVAGKRALSLGGIAYCASKFGMTALGTAAGNEESSNGIRITNVYPGEVETPILDQRPEPVSADRRAKMLQPEDIGALAVTIASLPPRAHVPEIVVKPTVQEYC